MKNSDMPAMPILGDRGERLDNSAGLTKREYLAGIAMQGLLSNPAIITYMQERGDDLEVFTKINISKSAAARADALLTELAK